MQESLNGLFLGPFLSFLRVILRKHTITMWNKCCPRKCYPHTIVTNLIKLQTHTNTVPLATHACSPSSSETLHFSSPLQRMNIRNSNMSSFKLSPQASRINLSCENTRSTAQLESCMSTTKQMASAKKIKSLELQMRWQKKTLLLSIFDLS